MTRASPHRALLARDSWLSTSARVTRPFSPVAWTDCRSTPSSRASLRVAGVARTFAPFDWVWLALAPAPVLAAALDGVDAAGACACPLLLCAAVGAAAGAPPATSIVTITAPTLQISPAGALILVTLPARGEGISTVALSVMTSTIG